MDQWVPAEIAIYTAMQAVEAMPADVRLTKAVTLLGHAMNAVADFVDGVEPSSLTDDRIRELWRSVRGPRAELNGPLIRFAHLVSRESR
jgi:hypothetical protein